MRSLLPTFSLLLLSAMALPAQQSLYSQWSNGPSASADFFPIGVWVQEPSKAAQFRAMGINTYITISTDWDSPGWDGPTNSELLTLKNAGMTLIGTQVAEGLASPHGSVLTGWALEDEPDNAQGDGNGGFGPPILPSVVQARYQALKAADPTRPVFLNFGQGVADENWNGRGTRAGHLEDYPEYFKAGDILSFDIYPIANASPPAEGKLEYVARGVERMVTWANGQKPVWNYIECTHIFSNTMATPDEMHTEVWMSLIHGTQGILYFVHEWVPSFSEAGVLRYPAMVAKITETNAQIQRLAPVLNSPTVVNGATVTSSNSSVPVAAMVKKLKGATWLFSVGMRRTATNATFNVAGLPAQATATVLGENREIPVINGVFQDSFAPYEVHLYEIKPTTLTADIASVGLAAGGTQVLSLNAGPAQANRNFWVFGSVTGTNPGTMLLHARVPLNHDPITQFTYSHPNVLIQNGVGSLNVLGQATATIPVPAGTDPVLIGTTLYTAFISYTGGVVHMASNAVSLGFNP